MRVKCIGTGSSGNCYALTDGNEILLLDLGMSMRDILSGIGGNIDKVVGALVTHKHKDHSKSECDIAFYGIPIAKGCSSWKFGGFHVQSFSVPHDEEPCVGYYIKHGNHRILYATDFEYIPLSFAKTKLTTMLVEVNYQDKYVGGNSAKTMHVLKGHASLATTKEIVRCNATECLQNVILCHLSKDNANGEEIIEEISKVAKKANVSVAKKNETYELGGD